MEKIEITLSKCKWDDVSNNKFTKVKIQIPKTTPDWGILQAIRTACIEKYGEEPWSCNISIPQR